MIRAAIMCVMLALTACGTGEGQRPPVDTQSSDASSDASHEQPVEAGPEAAPVEAAPPVDAGSDAMPDAPVDAEPMPVCCVQFDDAGSRLYQLCDAGSIDCELDAGYCTIDNVLGQLALCPRCVPGQTIAACNDADPAPLACSTDLQAIMAGNDLVCICTSSKCVYGDSTHCTTECR